MVWVDAVYVTKLADAKRRGLGAVDGPMPEQPWPDLGLQQACVPQ